MEKTITLNDVQMELLRIWKKADAEAEAALVKAEGTKHDDPAFGELVEVLRKTSDARDVAAYAFCMACAAGVE
jgi:hypothetical protein